MNKRLFEYFIFHTKDKPALKKIGLQKQAIYDIYLSQSPFY